MSTSKSRFKSEAWHRHRPLAWVLFWCYNYFIIHGSLLPSAQVPSFIASINGLIVHFVIYNLFFLITANAFYQAKSRIRFMALTFSFIYCQAVGFMTECLQNFIPGRAFQITDVLANVAGALGGLALWKWLIDSPAGSTKQI